MRTVLVPQEKYKMLSKVLQHLSNCYKVARFEYLYICTFHKMCEFLVYVCRACRTYLDSERMGPCDEVVHEFEQPGEETGAVVARDLCQECAYPSPPPSP